MWLLIPAVDKSRSCASGWLQAFSLALKKKKKKQPAVLSLKFSHSNGWYSSASFSFSSYLFSEGQNLCWKMFFPVVSTLNSALLRFPWFLCVSGWEMQLPCGARGLQLPPPAPPPSRVAVMLLKPPEWNLWWFSNCCTCSWGELRVGNYYIPPTAEPELRHFRE